MGVRPGEESRTAAVAAEAVEASAGLRPDQAITEAARVACSGAGQEQGAGDLTTVLQDGSVHGRTTGAPGAHNGGSPRRASSAVKVEPAPGVSGRPMPPGLGRSYDGTARLDHADNALTAPSATTRNSERADVRQPRPDAPRRQSRVRRPADAPPGIHPGGALASPLASGIEPRKGRNGAAGLGGAEEPGPQATPGLSSRPRPDAAHALTRATSSARAAASASQAGSTPRPRRAGRLC